MFVFLPLDSWRAWIKHIVLPFERTDDGRELAPVMVSSMTLHFPAVALFHQAGAIDAHDQIWVRGWSQVGSAGTFPCNHVRAHLLPQEGEGFRA